MRYRIFLSFLLLCATTVFVMGQKAASVKSFSVTTDHIPGSERRNDLNGNPCALVKIQVIDDVDRIEGNKIGSIVNKGVEKWVYMCKGSRNIRIHLKNHLPVKVMFQDYKINGLESNRVYELILEIPDAPAPNVTTIVQNPTNTSAKQRLTINYSPKHAMVLVDSKLYSGNGKIEIELPIGEHDYVIAAEGYITAEASVKLTEFAPREITETLPKDPSTVSASNEVPKKKKVALDVPAIVGNIIGKTKKEKNKMHEVPSKQKKRNKKHSKVVEVQEVNPDSIYPSDLSMNDILGREDNSGAEATVNSIPDRQVNGTFKYTYEGVSFKCKAKKGYVTILSFDTYATNVTIPARVLYDGIYYPVKAINTFVNGNNYSAEVLTVENGIETIGKYSFAEFRRLKDVTLPNSIKTIGKKAFRINTGMAFHLPSNINENSIRSGRDISVSK